MGDRVEWTSLERDVLAVTAFEQPHDFAQHFRDAYGPTIATETNARNNGRADEFVAGVESFVDDSNRGSKEHARFDLEYLVAVGQRR
jgi:hypothetical protein